MPRLRPDRPIAAFGLGAFAAVVVAVGALAQTTPNMLPENGTFDPPSGQGVLLDPGAGDQPGALVRKTAQTFGNPPAHGADGTGFDSTNARRKIDRKKQPQPLPRAVTTQIAPVQPLPPSPVLPPLQRQQADPVVTGSVGPPYAPPYAPPAKPKPKPPEIDPYEPLGIRAGSFTLRPAIDLMVGHDSNPSRDTRPKGSGLYTVAPELKAKSDWERHEFRANLRGSYSGYTSESSLDRPFFESVLDGRIDVTSQTRVELQNRFQYSADNPGTPNFDAALAKPTPYTNVGGTAGLFHRFNRLEIGGKTSIDRTTYSDSELTDGSFVSNDSRNFSTYGLELRGSYEWAPGIKPFIAVATDRRVYDFERDCPCTDRDSRGLTPRVG